MPRYDTLAHLLDACGFEFDLVPRLGRGVDRTPIQQALDLEPLARLDEGRRAAAGMEWLRDAYRRAVSRGD
jgi:hypothetical protein